MTRLALVILSGFVVPLSLGGGPTDSPRRPEVPWTPRVPPPAQVGVPDPAAKVDEFLRPRVFYRPQEPATAVPPTVTPGVPRDLRLPVDDR